MKIAIIIVTYNAEKYIEDCLSSLFKTLLENLETRVMVYDNASQDKTVEIIRNNFSKVKIIETGENLGFAGGNNIGMKRAISEGFDYIYLLNQDTVCGEGWLSEALALAEQDKKIGSVQSLLMLYPEKHKINSSGNEIHFLGFGYSGGYKKVFKDQELRPKEIAYASGAAVLLRREALEQVGFFNQDFFMYHEDLDLGWRMKMAGYKNMLAPGSIIYHKYEFSRSIKKYYYMERNRFWVLVQNYKLATFLLILPALLIMNLGLLFSSFVSGWWREEWKALVYFLSPKNWQKLLAKRKRVQAKRKFKDRQVLQNFTGKIEFQEVANPIVKYILNPIFSLYFRIIKLIIWW